MPNVLAHTYATSRVLGDKNADLILGSTLPDFAGMYKDFRGVRIDLRNVGFPADLGVYFHKKTDRIFDAQPEALKAKAKLTAELERAGIKPRASRLGATILVDTMSDTALLGKPAATDVFDELGESILDDATILSKEEFPDEFIRMVKAYFKESRPWIYSDPLALARIVYRRLNHRAKTEEAREKKTISPYHISSLAEVINDQYQQVHSLGLIALYRSIEILKADSVSPRS